MVPPTVSEPIAPWARQAARSRAPTLRADRPAAEKRSSSAGVRPMWMAPSRIPAVAGTAPAARGGWAWTDYAGAASCILAATWSVAVVLIGICQL